MDTIDQIKSVLEGDFTALSAFGPGQSEEAILFLVPEEAPRPAREQVEDLLQEFLSRGEAPRALALLKIISLRYAGEVYLLPLLERVLSQERRTETSAAFGQTAPSWALATLNPRDAWAVLREGCIELTARPPSDNEVQEDGWIICQDPNAISDRAPNGMALVWRVAASNSRKLSASERREGTRYIQHLEVKCRIVGDVEGLPPLPKFCAEVFDMSMTGVGLRLEIPYGQLKPEDLKGRHLRMRIPLPDDGRVLTVEGDIRWCRLEGPAHPGVMRLGVQFFDPPPALLEAIGDLIVVGKGDQQFLWNLWESQMRGS